MLRTSAASEPSASGRGSSAGRAGRRSPPALGFVRHGHLEPPRPAAVRFVLYYQQQNKFFAGRDFHYTKCCRAQPSSAPSITPRHPSPFARHEAASDSISLQVPSQTPFQLLAHRFGVGALGKPLRGVRCPAPKRALRGSPQHPAAPTTPSPAAGYHGVLGEGDTPVGWDIPRPPARPAVEGAAHPRLGWVLRFPADERFPLTSRRAKQRRN